jgi:UDP-N-acetylglucosamine 4,6-dehydratase
MAARGWLRDYVYSSDNNREWMSPDELKQWIELNRDKIGAI